MMYLCIVFDILYLRCDGIQVQLVAPLVRCRMIAMARLVF